MSEPTDPTVGFDSIEAAGLALVDPHVVAQPIRYHAAAEHLRREAPIHRVESDRYPPFWAVTRHAHVNDIERRPQEFTNTDWSVLIPKEQEDAAKERGGSMLHSLINMDGPEHVEYRGLTSDWFTNSSLKRLQPAVDPLAAAAVDRMIALGGTCDAAAEVAKLYPLRVIMSILGVSERDEPAMLRLTQELFGSDDDELRRGGQIDPVPIILDFKAAFDQITAQRRAEPIDDLASVLANAEVGGCPIGDRELLSYYVIIATAGHDTTSAAIAGGIDMLARTPGLLAELRHDAPLLTTFVDEVIRWVTPVKHFLRTAVNDCVVGGQPIAAGERLMMCYWSANRDEEVFTDPYRFDPRRQPNRHLGFGVGTHYCLGAGLAKLEMRSFFDELARRVDHLEATADAENVKAIFVSGPKHVPVRYAASEA